MFKEGTGMDFIEKTAAVLAGSLLLGLGIHLFLEPHRLLDGGLVGLALIFHYHFGFQTGLSLICLSIPIYIFAWHYDKKLFFRSLHGLLFSSLCVDLLSSFEVSWHLPPSISAVLGGMLIGLGIGLMLRYETTTGGTDLIAKIISERTVLQTGAVILALDACILLSGVKVVGLEIFLYSLLTIIFAALLTTLSTAEAA